MEIRTPVTVLTGFLGAGKTTLLQRILSEFHGQRIAVIENEFGQTSVDADLLFANHNEQIIELNNGCICCKVRGDLVRILSELQLRKSKGEIHFDRVIVETTGLADPAPVAQTFFVEDAVSQHYLLDAIVTVVDAMHGNTQLDTHHEAQEQVAFADRLLISKADLVNPEKLQALKERLRRMNPRAPMLQADFGRADLKQLLDIRGFSLEAALEIEPDFLQDDAHEHDDAISAFVYSSAKPFDPNLVTQFFQSLIQSKGQQLLRYKGVLNYNGFDQRVILQGVHMVMNSDIGPAWGNTPRFSHLVFIGKDLPEAEMREGLEGCLAIGQERCS